MGFVASAFGCPFDCLLLYLVYRRPLPDLDIEAVVRDIRCAACRCAVIGANTFGRPMPKTRRRIREAGIRKSFRRVLTP
jgi:hypothetical protein